MDTKSYTKFFEECTKQLENSSYDPLYPQTWDKDADRVYLKGLHDCDCTSNMLSYSQRMYYNIPLAVYTFFKILNNPKMEIDFITYEPDVFANYQTIIKSLVQEHKMSAFLFKEMTEDSVAFRGGGMVSRILVPDIPRPDIHIRTSSIVNAVTKNDRKFILHIHNSKTQSVDWYHIIRGFAWRGLEIS